MGEYAEDISFVLEEIIRFAKMEFEELKKLSFYDSLATLPHPSGIGELICGDKAFRRLRLIAETAISKSKYRDRLDTEAVFKPLKKIIIDNFVKLEADLNDETAEAAISEAIKIASSSIADRTHIIPCHLFFSEESNVDNFEIGPITFRTKTKAFDIYRSEIAAYLEQIPEGGEAQAKHYKEFSEKLHLDTREYYDSFGWTAEITNSGFDLETSNRRAERLTQTALDCFQVLIGTTHTYRMRVGGPHHRADRRGKIHINRNKNRASISTSSSWNEHYYPKNWWDQLKASGGEDLLILAGIALKSAFDLPTSAPLASRFIDAATWYGEAARDKFAASRIVKYVTAIERILITPQDTDNITKTIAERGSALISISDKESITKNRRRLRNIYRQRSKLVHGHQSPFESMKGLSLKEAEDLSRAVLLSFLIFAGLQRIQDKNIASEQLYEAYSRLTGAPHKSSYLGAFRNLIEKGIEKFRTVLRRS